MSESWLSCIFLLLVVTSLPVNSSKHPHPHQRSRDTIFKKPKNFVKVRLEAGRTRFTEAEKQLILQIHNSYRSLVEPSATDMRELEWDNDLEDYALNHTQACTGAHSGGRMTKKWTWRQESWEDWYNMGENLYYSHGSMFSIEEAMWMFWSEGKDYDINTMRCTHKNTCGHYMVLTTAKSYRVGCALNRCNKFSVSKYKTPAVFISCSYNAPFFTNAKPYTVGVACSDCKKQGHQFQFCRNKLCIGANPLFLKTGFNGNTSVVGVTQTSDIDQQAV